MYVSELSGAIRDADLSAEYGFVAASGAAEWIIDILPNAVEQNARDLTDGRRPHGTIQQLRAGGAT